VGCAKPLPDDSTTATACSSKSSTDDEELGEIGREDVREELDLDRTLSEVHEADTRGRRVDLRVFGDQTLNPGEYRSSCSAVVP
jgi:hypothetical protein